MTGKPRAEIFRRAAFNLLQNRTELRHLADKAEKILKKVFLFRIKKLNWIVTILVSIHSFGLSSSIITNDLWNKTTTFLSLSICISLYPSLSHTHTFFLCLIAFSLRFYLISFQILTLSLFFIFSWYSPVQANQTSAALQASITWKNESSFKPKTNHDLNVHSSKFNWKTAIHRRTSPAQGLKLLGFRYENSKTNSKWKKRERFSSARTIKSLNESSKHF